MAQDTIKGRNFSPDEGSSAYREVTRTKIFGAEKQGLDVVSYPPDGVLDAFSRMRVSQPQTLFDSKQIHDNQPLFWDDQEVSGSGTTSTHSADRASTIIGVAANTAGKRTRQTFQRFNYQPGKGHLVIMTARMDAGAAETGITARVGYFDDNNGLFFQLKDGVISVVRRTNVSGTPTDTVVPQSAWNLDRFDGSGNDDTNSSGIAIDPTASQILFIDFEWLGVGRVRFGFFIDGKPVYCHEFLNTNNLSAVYMSTPNLPIRYSIENDGNAGAASLEHICSTVASEGGAESLGTLYHDDSGALTTLANTATYAAIGLRLKSGYLGTNVLLEAASLIVTSGNDRCQWDVRFNPTVAGTFTYNDVTNSGVQIAKGSLSNTVTGGQKFDGGFFDSALPASRALRNARRLGVDISGTVDTVVLCLSPITNNISVESALTWRELS